MRRTITHGLAAILAAAATFAATQIDKHPRVQAFIDDEAIVIRHLGFSCGLERWSVKTLADSAASQIQFATPKRTTVPALVAIPSDHPSTREAPTETTVWQLTGVRVVAFKEEADSDIHAELQSVLPGHPTMIAEFPLASCITANRDPAVAAQQARIGTARATFLSYLQHKGIMLTGSYQTVNFQATIQGVGFFDFNHGQRGVAPNAVELHPVLSFQGW